MFVRLRIGSTHASSIIGPVRDAMVFYLFLSAVYGHFSKIPFWAYIITSMVLAAIVYLGVCYLTYGFSWTAEVDLMADRILDRADARRAAEVVKVVEVVR